MSGWGAVTTFSFLVGCNLQVVPALSPHDLVAPRRVPALWRHARCSRVCQRAKHHTTRAQRERERERERERALATPQGSVKHTKSRGASAGLLCRFEPENPPMLRVANRCPSLAHVKSRGRASRRTRERRSFVCRVRETREETRRASASPKGSLVFFSLLPRSERGTVGVALDLSERARALERKKKTLKSEPCHAGIPRCTRSQCSARNGSPCPRHAGAKSLRETKEIPCRPAREHRDSRCLRDTSSCATLRRPCPRCRRRATTAATWT